jgi:sporulation protein YlmC with PRC-barrel domain
MNIRVTGLACTWAMVVVALGASALAQAPAPSSAPATTAAPPLTVASVKLEPGFYRTSKMIGVAVYNDGKEKIGSIDDLIAKNDDNHITMVVVSVGGFLGIGNKLVVVPYEQLQRDPGDASKMLMPGANKDSLNAMPTFTYGG